MPGIWDLLWVSLVSNGPVFTRKFFVLVHDDCPPPPFSEMGWWSSAARFWAHSQKTLILQSKSEVLTLYQLLSLCYTLVCRLLGSCSLLPEHAWWAPVVVDASSSFHCLGLDGSHSGDYHSIVLLPFCKCVKVNARLMLALAGLGSCQLVLSQAGGEPPQAPVIYLPLTQWVNPCLRKDEHGSG